MDECEPDARPPGESTTVELTDAPARGLLLGLLAAQVGLVAREALLDAVASWAGSPTGDLGTLLLGRGDLDADRLALLRELTRAALDRNGGDPARAIAALDPPGSTLLALGRIVRGDLRAALPEVDRAPAPSDGRPRTPPGSGTTVEATPGATGGRRGRYRIVEFHRAGGLGKVSVAIDDELDRPVALKEIQDRYADAPEFREGFVYEAEVTGHLDHPGVVPVYGFGLDDAGRPYYAMRFIEGETLESAIARFHGPGGPRGRGPRALALRDLLNRFVDVCNAVEHAHSRGVIHRDLKPKNIMLGPHGETLVVDWGLAKPVGRPEGTSAGDAPTIRPSSGSHYPGSRDGDIKGTPSYMPPEQARGRNSELAAACDVYALGATLYEILVGRRAFPVVGGDWKGVLDRVCAGDFPPPRRASAAVPRPLESICLKAMAPAPEGRYASARKLAEDVERWLADEPVSAYREPLPARASRWLRHHRTASVAAAVLLVAAAVGLAIDDVRVSRERAETARALDVAREERERAEAERRRAVAEKDRAEASFGVARDAVDRIFGTVVGNALTFSASEDALRAALGEVALAFYERLLELAPDDGAVRQSTARVAREAGHLARLLGQFDRPAEHFRRAIGLGEALVARAPGEAAYRVEYALALDSLGELYRMNGRPRQAEPLFPRAIEALALPPGPLDADPARRRAAGAVRIDQAATLISLGRCRDARNAAEEAIGTFAPLARTSPYDALYLVQARRARAIAGREMGLASAAEETEEAVREARSLLGRDPSNRDFQFHLAAALMDQGELLAADPGRRAGAFRAFDEAAGILDPLWKKFVHVRFYRHAMAGALDGRGAVALATGQVRAAARDCDRARLLLEALLRSQDLPSYQSDLGRALAHLGLIARAEGDRARAADLLAQAVARQQAASEANPDDPDIPRRLASHRADLDALGTPPR